MEKFCFLAPSPTLVRLYIFYSLGAPTYGELSARQSLTDTEEAQSHLGNS